MVVAICCLRLGAHALMLVTYTQGMLSLNFGLDCAYAKIDCVM
jgi:hypothetical protein